MSFPSQIFFNNFNDGYRRATMKKNSLWLLPFYMVVAAYCYYEKLRRTMRSPIVSYLVNHNTEKRKVFFPFLKTIFSKSVSLLYVA